MSKPNRLIIKKEIGTISTYQNYDKIFSLTSYNGRDGKYDVRNWDKERQYPKKGITFNLEELKVLRNIIKDELLRNGIK